MVGTPVRDGVCADTPVRTTANAAANAHAVAASGFMICMTASFGGEHDIAQLRRTAGYNRVRASRTLRDPAKV